jgi:hypothetical protein
MAGSAWIDSLFKRSQGLPPNAPKNPAQIPPAPPADAVTSPYPDGMPNLPGRQIVPSGPRTMVDPNASAWDGMGAEGAGAAGDAALGPLAALAALLVPQKTASEGTDTPKEVETVAVKSSAANNFGEPEDEDNPQAVTPGEKKSLAASAEKKPAPPVIPAKQQGGVLTPAAQQSIDKIKTDGASSLDDLRLMQREMQRQQIKEQMGLGNAFPK